VLTFSHVGDGNVHSLALFTNDSELEIVRHAVHEMVYRAIRLDGTCSGEHGVGLGKVEYLETELGEGTVGLMETIKRTGEFEAVRPSARPLGRLKGRQAVCTGRQAVRRRPPDREKEITQATGPCEGAQQEGGQLMTSPRVGQIWQAGYMSGGETLGGSGTDDRGTGCSKRAGLEPT
jgi:hypothetical protein